MWMVDQALSLVLGKASFIMDLMEMLSNSNQLQVISNKINLFLEDMMSK
jgi:hypothetical protein